MPLPFARSASQTRPTFSRDFAGLKTLDHGVGPAITFTRASNATFFDASGVLQTAANDVPRFDHDPATGNASRGLLIEEARTNSFERSAEFDNAYWGKNAVTITANTSTAPDGTTSADTLSETIANAGHFVQRSISVTSGTSYTFSVFAKAGTSNILLLTLQDAGFGANTRAWFDLSTGAAGSTAGSPTATSIQPAGNGWHRCSITKAATATAASLFYIQIAESDGAFAAYVGDTADNILIWGAQLEAGAFPTSYIPTTTAAATRSADSAVVTPISGFYNQSEGTLFAEFQQISAAGGTAVSFDDGTLSNRIGYQVNESLQRIEARIVTGGARQEGFLTAGGSLSGPPTARAILAYKADDCAFASGFSSTVQTDNSVTLPSGVVNFRVGATATGTGSGHIRKIAYYPKRLSNTLLQQLTT